MPLPFLPAKPVFWQRTGKNRRRAGHGGRRAGGLYGGRGFCYTIDSGEGGKTGPGPSAFSAVLRRAQIIDMIKQEYRNTSDQTKEQQRAKKEKPGEKKGRRTASSKLLRRKRVRAFLQAYFKDGFNIPKLTRSIMILGVVEILLVLYCILFSPMKLTMSGIFLVVVASVGAVVSMAGAAALLYANEQFQSAEQTVGELEQFNRMLREQRHDFKNHLQVISALLEMEEYDEAQNYVRKITSDMRLVGRAMRTAQPAVNALLSAKYLLCENKGISFQLDITAKLINMPTEPWEICRVLGNLIDNAVEAQETEQVKNPVIHVDIHEKGTVIVMTVFNNGTTIPDSLKEQIFLADVSTKGEGHGMGLAIVSSIVERCGGTVSAESTDAGTTFTVMLPVKLRELTDGGVEHTDYDEFEEPG